MRLYKFDFDGPYGRTGILFLEADEAIVIAGAERENQWFFGCVKSNAVELYRILLGALQFQSIGLDDPELSRLVKRYFELCELRDIRVASTQEIVGNLMAGRLESVASRTFSE